YSAGHVAPCLQPLGRGYRCRPQACAWCGCRCSWRGEGPVPSARSRLASVRFSANRPGPGACRRMPLVRSRSRASGGGGSSHAPHDGSGGLTLGGEVADHALLKIDYAEGVVAVRQDDAEVALAVVDSDAIAIGGASPIVRAVAFCYCLHACILCLRPRFAPGPFSFRNRWTRRFGAAYLISITSVRRRGTARASVVLRTRRAF